MTTERRSRWLLPAAIIAALAAAVAVGWELKQRQAACPKGFAVVVPDELYRSGQPTARQLENMLRQYKVGVVISLRRDRPADLPIIAEEVEFLRSRGIEFRQIPTGTPPSPEQVRAFVAAINDPTLPRPLLIHCEAGRTRTGAMVAIWRMVRQGWTNEQALAEAREHGLSDADTVKVVLNFQRPSAASDKTKEP